MYKQINVNCNNNLFKFQMQFIDENEFPFKGRVPRLSMGERCFGKDISNVRQSKS